MATVLSVIFASIWLVSIQYVSGSQSTKTGTHPFLTIAWPHDIIVKLGTIISLPLGELHTSTANSRAAVPLQTPIPYFWPQYPAHSDSNLSRYLPAEDTQFVLMQSEAYFSSLPAIRGSFTGINLFFLFF